MTTDRGSDEANKMPGHKYNFMLSKKCSDVYGLTGEGTAMTEHEALLLGILLGVMQKYIVDFKYSSGGALPGYFDVNVAGKIVRVTVEEQQ